MNISRLSSLLLFPLLTFPALGQNPISNLAVMEDRPTLTSIGFQVRYSGDDNRNGSVSWRYRPQGTTAWRTAYPMLRVLPETVAGRAIPKQFAGSILDLRPNTTYEIEMQVQDPDGPGLATLAATSTTRNIPAPPLSPRHISVNSVAALRAAAGSAQPGDVITLQAGVYAVESLVLANSGTHTQPITLRGASAAGTILDGGGCFCNIIEVAGSYARVESMTLRNAFQGVRFLGAGASGNMLRYVTMSNVANAVNGAANQLDFYLADNDLEGRLVFPSTLDSHPGSPLQDTYGIAIYGHGHVVAHNRIGSFADGITVRQPGMRSLDIYGNEIVYSFDDAIELDGSEGNVRVMRNRVTNVFDGISGQPIHGGPAYILRNTLFNVLDEPFKVHGRAVVPPQEPSGLQIVHNTSVRRREALNMQGSARVHNSVLLNNLWIGATSAAGQQVGDWNSPLNQVRFDYNGYYPDGRFFFRTPAFTGHVPGFGSIYPVFGFEEHGRSLTAATFSGGQTGPALFEVRQSPQDLSLSPRSLAVDAGVPLSNLNDGFSGGSPDLGALELGCPAPAYGPRPTGSDETTPAPACASGSLSAPTVVAVSPTGRAAARSVFTMTAADSDGAQQIAQMSLAFGTGTQQANSCLVEWTRSTGQIYLWNDAGTARLGPVAAQGGGVLANRNCEVRGVGVALSGSQRLTWSVDVSFLPGYRQWKTVFGKADDATLSSGWVARGTWR